jgi:hypothetical protein
MTLLRWLLIPVVLTLGACANVAKISTGDVLVENRVEMRLDAAWNQVNIPGRGRTVLWTQDGITVDALEWWVGVKDGQNLVDQPSDKRPIAFRAAMQPHEVAALFEAVYSRDGSAVTVDKLGPSPFLGGPGYRIDYTVLRKIDDVRVSGMAWFTVRNNELFALTFTAPRLGFFPRHQPKVEQVARSARLKS